MRLLLDEMWAPVIAVELRKRDFDVVAINEPAQAGRYAGLSDDEVLRMAGRSSPTTSPTTRRRA